MDIDILGRNPEVAQLLVNLHDSQKLYELAKDKNDMLAKAELTNVMADLLSVELSVAEQDLLVDILSDLISQASRDLRLALSQRLSTMDNIPLRMVLDLANDDISVAYPILQDSPLLQDMDLIYIIKSKTEEYWQSIAQRKDLSGEVIDVLADTRDLSTAIILNQNEAITLTGHSIDIFSEMAIESEPLARSLLMREEVSKELAQKLYEYVSDTLKEFITQNYDIEETVMVDIVDTIDEVGLEFGDVIHSKFLPSDRAMLMAQRMADNGELSPSLMVETLRRGQIPSFIAMFSNYCKLPIPTVMEMVEQPHGQGLAIACKAMSIQKPDFVKYFLLTNKMRNGSERIVDQKTLARAIRYYEMVNVKVAQKILNDSRN